MSSDPLTDEEIASRKPAHPWGNENTVPDVRATSASSINRGYIVTKMPRLIMEMIQKSTADVTASFWTVNQ